MTYGEDPMVKAMQIINNLTRTVDMLNQMNDKLKERLDVEMQINQRTSEENFQQDYVEDRIGQ